MADEITRICNAHGHELRLIGSKLVCPHGHACPDDWHPKDEIRTEPGKRQCPIHGGELIGSGTLLDCRHDGHKVRFVIQVAKPAAVPRPPKPGDRIAPPPPPPIPPPTPAPAPRPVLSKPEPAVRKEPTEAPMQCTDPRNGQVHEASAWRYSKFGCRGVGCKTKKAAEYQARKKGSKPAPAVAKPKPKPDEKRATKPEKAASKKFRGHAVEVRIADLASRKTFSSVSISTGGTLAELEARLIAIRLQRTDLETEEKQVENLIRSRVAQLGLSAE